MIRTWPELSEHGWHAECGWTWESFGIIICFTHGQSFVIRIGWAYVSVWK